MVHQKTMNHPACGGDNAHRDFLSKSNLVTESLSTDRGRRQTFVLSTSQDATMKRAGTSRLNQNPAYQ